jgi:uncharacterized RDD family membrane protein YckC
VPRSRISTAKQKTPDGLVGVGLGRRLAAGIADGLATVAIMVLLALTAGVLRPVKPAILIVATLMPLLYFVIGEHYYQTTPGKRLFGLRIVTVAGGRPDILATLVRTMSRPIEAMLIVPYVATIALSQRHQRFGDMIAECVVVRAGNRA